MAAVDFSALLEVVWVALLAGVGVTVLFSLVVYGLSRAAELRRADQGGPATMFGALAVVAAVAFTATVILGVSILLNK